MAEQWLVVLRPDGVVEAVDGGASVSWLGRSLVDAPGAPDALRRAVVEVMRAPPNAHVRRRKVSCTIGERPLDVDLLLVEGLPLRRALTSVHDLVMRTLDLFASQAKSNDIELTFDLAEDVTPAVVVDREKIAWAISTLIANALRYARKHVAVFVTSDRTTRDLVIEVTDDGPGIPEQQARWLFDHNPATGKAAGLALLMVRDVVVAHRGSISVANKNGSAFTLRLPHGSV